jgi:DNA polymerase-1
MTVPTLFLIDTFSLLFQVFHAIPSMTSPRGLPTNAVFGFTRDLLQLLTLHHPTHWLCALDSPGPGTREELFPKYKANRTEMPEDLRPQIEMVQRVMDVFGIPKLQCSGWEADDVIATLTRAAVERGFEVRIVTNDKDVRQLLGPHVQILNVRKNTWLDEAGLLADWGIRPEQVIDFQSLVGDNVDNVPGVPLVGPKKATALLEQFGTLDEVLANADKVAGAKLKSNLREFADQARLSRKLVTLNQHLDLPIDFDAMRVGQIDIARLTELFREFGFRRFIDEAKSLPAEYKLPGSDEASAATVTNRRWELIATDEELAGLIARWKSHAEFGIELVVSPTGSSPSEIVALSLVWEDEPPKFVPLNEATPPAGNSQVPVTRRQQSLFANDAADRGGPFDAHLTSIWDKLRPILESTQAQIVAHDLKEKLLRLRRVDVRATGLGIDPMVASYLLEAGARGHDLAALAEKWLQQTVPPFDAALLTDTTLLGDWCCKRLGMIWQLSHRLADELRRANLWELYWTLERPLIGVLADMEATGIRVDVAELQAQSAEIALRLSNLMAEIHQHAGHEFNIDSPKQLAKVLFEELHLPVLKKTKTGASTDQEVLEKLALVHPLPAKIIEHRQLTKLKGTYLDTLPQMVHPRTGKIHARFNQVVAATGRLSSSDPNLQNIPIRTTEGQRVRKAFIPSVPGWKFVCADYSQIELRMLAHFSRDPVLCEAFAHGTDIHTAVAAEIFNVDLAAVTSEQRRVAKAVNFGVLYGQSAYGLSEALHIDQEEAELFIKQYFAKYAAVDEYITRTLAQVAETGFATTILGRRRAISGIRPERKRPLNMSERTAVNTVIQGSAADLIKQAMLRVHDRLRQTQHPGRLLLQIHDELVLETPAPEVESLAALVREEMTGAMSLSVPLAVDLSVGDNWRDQHELHERHEL